MLQAKQSLLTFPPPLSPSTLRIASAVLSDMADQPQPSSLLQPDFKSDTSTPINAKPLTPNAFTGMVNTSDAAIERRFKGTFNMLGDTDLYNRRLQANLMLIREHGGGYAEWNRKRQVAIDSGEDPNAELIAKIEARQPDSYLERAWRRLKREKPKMLSRRRRWRPSPDFEMKMTWGQWGYIIGRSPERKTMVSSDKEMTKGLLAV